jgi:hypothetical protein
MTNSQPQLESQTYAYMDDQQLVRLGLFTLNSIEIDILVSGDRLRRAVERGETDTAARTRLLEALERREEVLHAARR